MKFKSLFENWREHLDEQGPGAHVGHTVKTKDVRLGNQPKPASKPAKYTGPQHPWWSKAIDRATGGLVPVERTSPLSDEEDYDAMWDDPNYKRDDGKAIAVKVSKRKSEIDEQDALDAVPEAPKLSDAGTSGGDKAPPQGQLKPKPSTGRHAYAYPGAPPAIGKDPGIVLPKGQWHNGKFRADDAPAPVMTFAGAELPLDTERAPKVPLPPGMHPPGSSVKDLGFGYESGPSKLADPIPGWQSVKARRSFKKYGRAQGKKGKIYEGLDKLDEQHLPLGDPGGSPPRYNAADIPPMPWEKSRKKGDPEGPPPAEILVGVDPKAEMEAKPPIVPETCIKKQAIAVKINRGKSEINEDDWSPNAAQQIRFARTSRWRRQQNPGAVQTQAAVKMPTKVAKLKEPAQKGAAFTPGEPTSAQPKALGPNKRDDNKRKPIPSGQLKEDDVETHYYGTSGHTVDPAPDPGPGKRIPVTAADMPTAHAYASGIKAAAGSKQWASEHPGVVPRAKDITSKIAKGAAFTPGSPTSTQPKALGPNKRDDSKAIAVKVNKRKLKTNEQRSQKTP